GRAGLSPVRVRRAGRPPALHERCLPAGSAGGLAPGGGSGATDRLLTPVPAQLDRGLQQQRVHECLRQIAAELPLGDVVLLGIESGWTTGCPVPLEPGTGLRVLTLLRTGQRSDEAAEQERPLGLSQRSPVVPEPVDVPVLGQLVQDRCQSGSGPRVL